MRTSQHATPVRLWQSLRLRLPLLFALLIAAVLATFLFLSYREVRASLLGTGGGDAPPSTDLTAQRLLNRMVVLALVVFAGGVGVMAIVSTWMSRPLRELSNAAARIADGDYSGRVVTTRADEIGRLADAFNAMASEIERGYDALKRKDDRKQFALGAAHMGIFDIDVAADRVTWSDTMARIFGREPDQAPRTIEEFYGVVHPEDRPLVLDAIARAEAERAEEFFLDYRAMLADGSVRWIEETARVLYGEDGRATSLLGVAMDVTGRKALETQLRGAQRMEAIGQLAGGIAHDFNNLLTAILGYAKLLGDALPPDDVRRRDVHGIHEAAERAAGLTRQLLAFSRQQVLQPTAMDLNALVVDTSQMLRRLIGEHIDLVTDLGADLALVLADKTQLEQVIVNLAVNARDAMTAGGTLAISTANVDLDETYATQHAGARPGPYVMLAVSDTGVGMNETTRRRVFEPFFTTKERGKGTGLGLATVYGIVKQSGGYIWVYSEPGRGAAFKGVPAARGSGCGNTGGPARDTPEGGGRIRHRAGRGRRSGRAFPDAPDPRARGLSRHRRGQP